jgi:hypothetical protein
VKEKLLIFAVVLLMVAFVPGVSFSQDQAMSMAGFAAKAGIDLSGELEGEGDSVDVEMGFTLGAEYLFPLGVVNVGPGLAFLIPRGIDEEDATGKIGFLPVYAVVNVPIPVQGSVLPYIFGRVGYSFVTDDSAIADHFEGLGAENVEGEGGIYWGIGAGVLFAKNIIVELCYATHALSITGDDPSTGDEHSIDADYTYINISVGYKF